MVRRDNIFAKMGDRPTNSIPGLYYVGRWAVVKERVVGWLFGDRRQAVIKGPNKAMLTITIMIFNFFSNLLFGLAIPTSNKTYML